MDHPMEAYALQSVEVEIEISTTYFIDEEAERALLEPDSQLVVVDDAATDDSGEQNVIVEHALQHFMERLPVTSDPVVWVSDEGQVYFPGSSVEEVVNNDDNPMDDPRDLSISGLLAHLPDPRQDLQIPNVQQQQQQQPQQQQLNVDDQVMEDILAHPRSPQPPLPVDVNNNDASAMDLNRVADNNRRLIIEFINDEDGDDAEAGSEGMSEEYLPQQHHHTNAWMFESEE